MAARPIQLKVIAGPNLGETCLIFRYETSIGRDKKNDIVVLEPTVSRQHALIRRQGKDVVIIDLDSTNGTFVNKEKINSPRILKPGDTIHLGEKVVLQFNYAVDDPQATLHKVAVLGEKQAEVQQSSETQTLIVQKSEAAAEKAVSSVSEKATEAVNQNAEIKEEAEVAQMEAQPQSEATESESEKSSEEGEGKKGKLIDLSQFIAQMKQNAAQAQAAASATKEKEEEEIDENLPAGVRMTKQQENILAYNLDEEPDLWLILFFGYIVSGGKKSEELKKALIDDSEEWKQFVQEVKSNDLLQTLTVVARDRLTRWNIIIKNLLSDQGHSRLFRMYLQALMAQKIKKVVGFGGRAQLKKQMNTILAVIAGNVLANLDKYDEAAQRLASGKNPDGSPLTETQIKFYEPSKVENLKQIALLLAVIVIFRNATCADDIKKLQEFIRVNLIAPLKLEADAMPSGYEKMQVNKRIEGYMQLIKTVDISFG